MSELSEILREEGHGTSTDEMFAVVYQELKRLAAKQLSAEPHDHTLQATALVHEVYLRLSAARRQPYWQNRGHFFAAAAQAMRRILIDWARHKGTGRAGGRLRRQDPEWLAHAVSGTYDADMLLDIDAGLTKLAAEDAEAAQLAELRLFAGLSVSQAGVTLNMSRTTAYETWKFARAWFALHIGEAQSP